MKNTLRFLKKITPLLALAAIIMVPNWGWGQTYLINEGFESPTFPPTGWTNNKCSRSTTSYRSIPASLCFNEANDEIITPIVVDPANLSFYYRRSSNSTAWTLKVYYGSAINGPWYEIGSITTASTTYQEFTYDLSSFSNIYIRLKDDRTTGSHERYVDDFSITQRTSSSPNITLDPTILAGFTYIQGSGPSAEQSFTVAGSNLTGDITLTPPTNYEISTGTGGAFSAANPLTLSPTSGNVASTPIYVRLKAGLGVGDYNGEEITATSTGAVNKTVTCSGSVTAPPDAEPTNHVTNYGVGTGSPAYSTIDVIWDDATGGVVPTAYLIKGSSVSYGDIAAPQDGTPEADAALVKNIVAGIETASFSGLSENTTYYFKIWPYTNSGSEIDYKTDGAVPQDVATTATAPAVPAIYFSEYIEGSSNNKALEIFNNTGSSIDLALLTVKNYANGASTPTNTFTGTGSLNPGATYIIANASADSEILNIADVKSTVTNYNGDDAVELIYNGQTVDIIGVIGNDPGTAWDVAGISNATANHTLIRKLNVTTGNTNWATSAGTDVNDSEWVVKDQDYFGNLIFVGTVWQGATTAWADEVNWDMGVPSTYQAWVVPATETPVVSTTETVSDVIVLGNNLHISPTGFLTVENLLGILESGVVTVEPLGQLSGEIYNFGNEASLIVQSDETGTGSIITSVSGNEATIQRYLTGGWGDSNSGWHQLSSPVAAQPIAAFASSGAGNDYDFYGWNETGDMWMNYKDAGFQTWNGSLNFNVGQGYLVSYEAANTTKTFTGELNVADVTIENMSYGGSAHQGWHLLGNPYASALVWNDGTNWYLENVSGVAKIWSEAAKSYSDITANGIIPSAQGFMVQVSSAANGITIPTVSRVHDAQPFYKSGNAQLLLVAAETEGGSAQESRIMVNPMATEGFDFDYDSRFLAGYAPQLYSVVGDELLSTNSLPDLASGKVIPLGFVKNAATTFTIELKESIPGTVVYLTDIQTGTVTNLTETPVYSFTSAEGDDANRFALAFGSLGIDKPADNEGVQVFAYGGMLYVQTSSVEPAVVNVYNLTGQLVMQSRTGSATLSTFNASALGRGVYVVNVIFKDKVVSRKVVNQY